ncbi:MAG: hypothetical protein ACK5SH_09830, partial [Pseudomonadota bacterium]
MNFPRPSTPRLAAALLALALAAPPRPASASGLPLDAGGQPVATIAPMLEQVTPAVVNINTRT